MTALRSDPSAGSGSALDHLTVVDLSRVLAGPYATMMLGDFGADVIKVERPGVGDETRSWLPPIDDGGTATYFTAVNRNKRSVICDLADPVARDRLVDLILTADVVVENFRPGVMERLGLGYETLAALHPRLVFCSITGFGRSPAGASLPGFDLLVQAVGGLMSITGPRPGEPTKTGVALVDVITGLHATTGILAALLARERTGIGQRVEVDLLSSLLSALVNQASGYLGAGVVPGITGNAHPSIAPYEVFQAADGPLVVAVGTDGQFRSFTAALERSSWALDPRFTTNLARVLHRGELAELIAERLSGGTVAEWCALMASHDVPAGPLHSIDEAFAFAERLGLSPTVDLDGVPQVANPITLSATPARYRLRPPRLGQDGSLPASPRSTDPWSSS